MQKDTEEKNLTILDIFIKYASDNREVLSILGVIATITALFLNLDPTVYQNGLRSLQLLLLLLLELALIFSVFVNIKWIAKNADSWFAGLISFTLLLFIWKLQFFIIRNFRNELNQYLETIFFSATIVAYVFIHHIRKLIEKRFPKHVIQYFLQGLTTYFTLYAAHVFVIFYTHFFQEKPVNFDLLIDPFKIYIYKMVALWAIVISFYYGEVKEQKKWMEILVFLPVPFLILHYIYFFKFLVS